MKATLHNQKRPAWFLTFLLVFSLTLGAMAEAGTIFPWLSYTLDVALVSTDAKFVDDPDAPDDGAVVMVKLISTYGTISIEDILSHSKEITFRDAHGDEYSPYSQRVRGVNFDAEKGSFSTRPQQDGFELLYSMKEKAADAVTGAKLLIPTGVEGERVVVSLDQAPHDAEVEEVAENTGMSFMVGDMRYTISALEDEPTFMPENFLDSQEGHLVSFTYPGPGKEAEEANQKLYSGARLIEPGGNQVIAYSNSDNIGNPYELFFGLSDDVLLADCIFTIQSDEGKVKISLSEVGVAGADIAEEPQATAAATEEPSAEPTAEPTIEPTAEPTQEPTPEPEEGSMERKIVDVLTQCTKGITDEWQLAIYRAGVQEVRPDPEKEGVYTFRLRSFDPGLKELGKYQEENRQYYLARMLENTRTYGLEVSLILAGGEFSAKSVKALQSAVKKAAAASMKAFKDTRVQSAITDELFFIGFGKGVKKAEDLFTPSPEYLAWVNERSSTLSSLSGKQWVPFFYGQIKHSLDVKGGPFALILKSTGVNMNQLLEKARADALHALAFLSYERRWDGDRVDQELLRALANNAFAMKKKGKEVFTVTLNVDEDSFYGSDYEEMLAAYDYSGTLEELQEDTRDLPDVAAREYPKAGWLSGSQRGTKVNVKAPRDSDAYYVQLRDYDSDALVVAGFVRPGSTCSLRVPKGDYYFVMASGPIWYGEEVMFGDDTEFTKTGLFNVLSSKYYHTVTLRVKKGGNLPVYGADEDDLR